MPWKESCLVDERMKFVARLLEGERMAELCREYGISRKTGYKIWNRYQRIGLNGLTDRSRRPIHYAHQLPMQIEAAIVRLKKEKPSWGAPKIREILVTLLEDLGESVRQLEGSRRPPGGPLRGGGGNWP